MKPDFLAKLIASQYPGAVRVFAVNIVAIFCVVDISNFFSVSFLTISFVTSIAGVAVSTQAYVTDRKVSTKLSVALIFLLTILATPIAFQLWEYSLSDFSIIISISVFYSLFELCRSQLMAHGEFEKLAIRSIFCIIAVSLSVLAFNKQAILLTTAIVLVIFITVLSRKCFISASSEKRRVIAKDIASYSISNVFSTGFSFLFPLILIQEFGPSSATTIAQVFTFSVVFFAYPRLLSASFLNLYKSEREIDLYVNFDRKCYKFSAALSSLVITVVYLLLPNLLEYLLFIIALICSQLSLPASNLMMAEGKGQMLLKVSVGSLLILISIIALTRIVLEPSILRLQLILFSYLAYQIGKYVALKFYIIPNAMNAKQEGK